MNPAEFDQLETHQERLWWFRGMRRIVDSLLDLHCPSRPGSLILEAGCGTGFDAARFSRQRGWRVAAVDLSSTAARMARRRGLTPAVANIQSLPFAGALFQGVISLDVLVHLGQAEQSAAIHEFARVLAPGGWMLLRVAALRVLRSRHSDWTGERHRVRLSELSSQARNAGLQIRFATYANALLLPVALAKFRIYEPLAKAKVASSVHTPSAWLNTLLEIPLRAEHIWLQAGGRLPIGQSVYLVAEKPA